MIHDGQTCIVFTLRGMLQRSKITETRRRTCRRGRRSTTYTCYESLMARATALVGGPPLDPRVNLFLPPVRSFWWDESVLHLECIFPSREGSILFDFKPNTTGSGIVPFRTTSSHQPKTVNKEQFAQQITLRREILCLGHGNELAFNFGSRNYHSTSINCHPKS
jgi:hypothetical protein